MNSRDKLLYGAGALAARIGARTVLLGAIPAFAAKSLVAVSLGGAVALSDLDNYLAPTYVRLIPHKDGWSHDFFVSADLNWGVSGSKDYMIECYGRDGVPETSAVGPKTDFDCDIVYSGGIFRNYPEGVQSQ